MKKISSRIIALIMAIVMLVGVSPAITASAMNEDVMPDEMSETVWNQQTGVTNPSALGLTMNTSRFLIPIEPEDADSKPINNATELAQIGKNSSYPLNGKYHLTTDIDLSEWGNWKPIGEYDYGGSDSKAFKGVFDGQGHIIYGLTITNKIEYGGLFGYITNGATIKNIALENSNVVNTNYSSIKCYTGILVGYVYGTNKVGEITIQNCYTTGNIAFKGSASSIGGIVGYSSNAKITITDCYNSANVESPGFPSTSYGGGIIGYGSGDITIERCNNNGDIYSTSGNMGSMHCSAGIIGYSSNTDISSGTAIINECYNTGNIDSGNAQMSTKSYAGGIVGNADGGIQIKNSYNTGEITCHPNMYSDVYSGGIVGYSSNGTAVIQNCYNVNRVIISGPNAYTKYVGSLIGYGTRSVSYSFYLAGTTILDTNNGGTTTTAGTVKTIDEMKSQSTYTGWDFDTVWGINSDVNNGYPYLRNVGAQRSYSFTPMSRTEALIFLRFIYNDGIVYIDGAKHKISLSDSDLKAGEAFKLITGRYRNEPEKENLLVFTFLQFVYHQTNAHITKSEHILEYARTNLQEYFENELTRMNDLPEEIINEYQNKLYDYLYDGLVDMLSGVAARVTGTMLTENNLADVKDVFESINIIEGYLGKLGKIFYWLEEAAYLALSPYAAELQQRYSYFNVCLSFMYMKRDLPDAYRAALDMDLDLILMDETKSASQIINCMPGAAETWNKHTDTIERWAEFVYNLERRQNIISLESISLDKTSMLLERDQSDTLTVHYQPVSTTDNKTVIWSTSDANVATVNNGVVTATSSHGEATITAKVGAKETSCIVTVTLNDVESVARAKAALTWSVIQGMNTAENNVTADLDTLPLTGANNTTISWSSNNTAVVSNSGVVTRPAYGSGDATVKLTATITKGSASETVVFNLTVKELPQTDAQAVAADKAVLTWSVIKGTNTAENNVTANLDTLPLGRCKFKEVQRIN